MGQGISTPEDQVEDALDRINTALDDLRDLNLTCLPDKAVLGMTEKIQYTSCRLFAVLVRGVNEVDVRGLAAVNGASSTAMLIRQRLKISSGQSNNLVRVGKATRCTVQPSGAVSPPELEEVADILDTGELNEESAGIIVRYMKTIPAEVDEPTRREVETTLLDQAVMFDPHQVRDAAREISIRIDPDGKLPKEATARMTFEIGNRNIDGLTKISGSLDDLTIERLKKALMGLSAPKPGAVRGTRPTLRRATAGPRPGRTPGPVPQGRESPRPRRCPPAGGGPDAPDGLPRRAPHPPPRCRNGRRLPGTQDLSTCDRHRKHHRKCPHRRRSRA